MRFVQPPPLSDIQTWRRLDHRCKQWGEPNCKRYLDVYHTRTGRKTSSTRSEASFIDEMVCYVSEPEYVDSNGTIWGAEVTCVEYIGDDGIDPFGYRIPGAGGGGGGVLPLPCHVSTNSTINSLVSGDPVLQSILAAVQAKYGSSVTFNVVQGASPTGVNAQAHYDTNSIDFYTVHSGIDPAQIVSHEGLHLFNEQPDPTTGVRPNPFPGESNFQATRVVTLTDGTQLTFNIAAGADGTLNLAYTGYDHYLIHDQLVALYDEDDTSALYQAFAQADSVTLPGGTPQKMTSDQAKAAAESRKSTRSSTSTPAPPPPATLPGCNSTLSLGRKVEASSRSLRGLDHVGRFLVNWDGEIAF